MCGGGSADREMICKWKRTKKKQHSGCSARGTHAIFMYRSADWLCIAREPSWATWSAVGVSHVTQFYFKAEKTQKTKWETITEGNTANGSLLHAYERWVGLLRWWLIFLFWFHFETVYDLTVAITYTVNTAPYQTRIIKNQRGSQYWRHCIGEWLLMSIFVWKSCAQHFGKALLCL